MWTSITVSPPPQTHHFVPLSLFVRLFFVLSLSAQMKRLRGSLLIGWLGTMDPFGHDDWTACVGFLFFFPFLRRVRVVLRVCLCCSALIQRYECIGAHLKYVSCLLLQLFLSGICSKTTKKIFVHTTSVTHCYAHSRFLIILPPSGQWLKTSAFTICALLSTR